nr:ABC-three component system protein [Duganella lactea]
MAGAAVPDSPKLYVIGSFDKRITFYSQQARALSLVHALHDQGHLKDCKRVAVIGAGAAGVTAAAALLLATSAKVVLFDSAPNMLSLQGATERRKLDPHIYDWPKIDTTDRAANLPLLDWESGSSKQVRMDVIKQFEQIVACRPELEKKLGCKVTKIERDDKVYKVAFTRIGSAANPVPEDDNPGYFDMVFLAIGFGVEPKQAIRGVRSASYWSDAGVPGPEFDGRPSPSFFISGNGDGGLIDFVAAASSDFNHGTMLSLITENLRMEAVRSALQDIDKRAREVEPGQPPLDLWAAYETEIHPLIRDNGLVHQFRMQMRPGVRLVLQTREKQIFSLDTAVLNRLAVYVSVKACQEIGAHIFKHIHCGEVTSTISDDDGYLLNCDGIGEIAADEVIVRRGPNRDAVREPFQNVLNAYGEAHARWLARYKNMTVVPGLSQDARSFFEKLCRDAGVPPSPRIQNAAIRARRFKMTRDGTNIHWTGAVAKTDLAQIWSTSNYYELVLADGAESLGKMAPLVLRIAGHCKNLTVYSDRVFWDGLIKSVIDKGPAKGLNKPLFGEGLPAGATEEPHDFPLEALAEELHHHLDRWVLTKVDNYISKFLADGTEEGTDIALTIAQDLREMMAVTWKNWTALFDADPALLGNFLCLMMNSNHAEHPAARVLVGPSSTSEIILGVVVSLAIASCWNSVGPKAALPGNLHRKFDAEPEWAGHTFAATRINGKHTLRNVAEGMWRTEFVVLAVDGALDSERASNLSFRDNSSDELTFSVPLGHEPVMLTLSGQFCEAMELGAAALTKFLAGVDARRFIRWDNVIDKRTAA